MSDRPDQSELDRTMLPGLHALAVPIGSVHVNPDNSNQHDERSVTMIAASLAKYRQRKPCVARADSRVLEAGNGTLEAARQLGWKWIAVVFADDTNTEAAGYEIADNQSATYSYADPDIVHRKAKELLADGFDLSHLAFDQRAFSSLIATLKGRQTPAPPPPPEPTPPPEPSEPVTRPGEVLELGPHRLHCGDCVPLLASLPSDHADACVTDPPYGIGFMGATWDAELPGPRFAAELFRVLKPGAHAVVFAATRTLHLQTMNLARAGFEVRDLIGWLQWQGMPKSADVSAAIDKRRHDLDQILRVTGWIREARDRAGLTNADLDAPFGFAGMAGHWTSRQSQPGVPTLEQLPTLLETLGVAAADVPSDIRELFQVLNDRKGQPGDDWLARDLAGHHDSPPPLGVMAKKLGAKKRKPKRGEKRPLAATQQAAQWSGWGTGLKPALEPAVLVRKPFKGTVADNVLQWGTGALNIEATRIAHGDPSWPGPPDPPPAVPQPKLPGGIYSADWRNGERYDNTKGRFPANIYYCPKAGADERTEGIHQTVKPVRLMRWLLQLVTPPGGIVLEPFAGSGSTIVAAHGLDLQVIAAELEPRYCDIAAARWRAIED